jgi:hypothetical protein
MEEEPANVEERFLLYKLGCVERGIDVPLWREWLEQGQPTWGHEEDE